MPKPVILLRETYLAAIRNSLGSNLFRRLYIQEEKRSRDVLEKGKLGCAYFVSFLLTAFGLLGEPHATVAKTMQAMRESGWRRTRRIRPGSVIVWVEKQFSDGPHRHIGFALDRHTAISMSTKRGVPRRHHMTFGPRGSRSFRPIERIYFHSKPR